MQVLNKNKIIVKVSDAMVSQNPSDIIATYSLGSCIGVCLYDTFTGVGGMLHYQLPDSSLNPERAHANPYMFADTGLKALYNTMKSFGVRKSNIHAVVAGGASIAIAPQGFDIGKRNHLAIRKLMWKLGVPIKSEDVGGSCPRTVFMDIADGQVTIKRSE